MDYILTVFSLGIRLTWIVIFADQKTYQNYNVWAKFCCEWLHSAHALHSAYISNFLLGFAPVFFLFSLAKLLENVQFLQLIMLKKNKKFVFHWGSCAFSDNVFSRGIWTHNLRFNLRWELPGNPVPLFDLLHKVCAELLSLPRMLLLEPVRGSWQASHARAQGCTAGKRL